MSAKKKRDFAKFKHLATLFKDGKHLTYEGLKQILEIRKDMNDGGAERRKYTDAEILCQLERESSETIR